MEIVMCSNTECSMHEQCYHFMAVPSKTQVYVDMNPSGGDCPHFWDIKNHPEEA